MLLVHEEIKTDGAIGNNGVQTSSHSLTVREIEQYQRDGFVILRKLFSDSEVLPVQNALNRDPTIGGSERTTKDRHGNLWPIAISTSQNDTYLGALPRLTRMVDAAETLLGESVYFWHIKFVRKAEDTGGEVGWHQDYAFWYEACLKPDFATGTLAVDANDRSNGCLQVLAGSHKMGRLDMEKNVAIADRARVEEALRRYPLVHCEMQPGDVIFFHPLLLHASPPNLSSKRRTLLHCIYNAVSNAPFRLDGQEHRAYRPLHKIPDNDFQKYIKGDVFKEHQFFEYRTLNLVDGSGVVGIQD